MTARYRGRPSAPASIRSHRPAVRQCAACAVALALSATLSAAADLPEPRVGAAERLLVIAPHPDDETLGAGGLMQRVHANGGEVRIVLVTAGDGFVEAVVHETGTPRPRPAAYIAYGEERLREARAAVRTLLPDRYRLQVLGFPDGGLDGLLQAHWWRSRPERSRTTFATDPPYDDQALEPDVPYDGDDLRRELEHIIREMRPTIVVLPDPLDRHPDHRAAALFTLLALQDWHAANPKEPQPQLLGYLVHWPDWPPGWNETLAPERAQQTLELPPGDVHRDGRRVAFVLSDTEMATKRAALQHHVTQLAVMGPFLTAFLRRNEPYTVLPPAEMKRTAEMIENGVGPAPQRRPLPRHEHGKR